MVLHQFFNAFITTLQRLYSCFFVCVYQLMYGFSISNQCRLFMLHCLREHVFSIQGSCNHSGNCCRHIMVYDKGAPINTLEEWTLFKQRMAQTLPFNPNIEIDRITSYDCKWLMPNNHCNHYDDRPTMCHNYPHSFFYENGYLLPNCGYYVEENPWVGAIMVPSIKHRVYLFNEG